MSEYRDDEGCVMPINVDGMKMTIVPGLNGPQIRLGWPGDDSYTSMPKLGAFTRAVRAAAAQSAKKPGDDE